MFDSTSYYREYFVLKREKFNERSLNYYKAHSEEIKKANILRRIKNGEMVKESTCQRYGIDTTVIPTEQLRVIK